MQFLANSPPVIISLDMLPAFFPELPPHLFISNELNDGIGKARWFVADDNFFTVN